MITEYILPDDVIKFEQDVLKEEDKYIWRDIPNNRVVIYTGDDYIAQQPEVQ